MSTSGGAGGKFRRKRFGEKGQQREPNNWEPGLVPRLGLVWAATVVCYFQRRFFGIPYPADDRKRLNRLQIRVWQGRWLPGTHWVSAQHAHCKTLSCRSSVNSAPAKLSLSKSRRQTNILGAIHWTFCSPLTLSLLYHLIILQPPVTHFITICHFPAMAQCTCQTEQL